MTASKVKGLMLVSAALWVSPAVAQQSADAPAQDQGAAASGMEDIVVTAQRRSERLQNVPIAVSAVGQTAMREMAVSRPSDLVAQIPNLKFQAAQGGQGLPIFNIRGVTLLDFTDTNEASVAVYADDIYLGSPNLGNQQLFDLQRVEVLRGPQGTLYGRNAVGGLINYISNRPTDTLEGYVTLGYGKDNDAIVEGAVSGPLSESVRGRLAGRFQRRDGWQTNVINGSHFGDIDHAVGVRAIIDADLSPTFKISLQGNYNNFKGEEEEAGFYGARVPGSNPGVRCSDAAIFASQCTNGSGYIDPSPSPRQVASDLTEQPVFVRSHGGLARAEWDLGFATITSLTGYYYAKRSNDFDADGSPLPALRFITASTHKQFSQELRIGGTSGILTWTTGAYYYTDKRFFTVTLPQAGGLGDYVDQDIDTWGLFGQATVAVTPTVNLTGGIRYTHDKREADIVRVSSGGVPLERVGTQTWALNMGFKGGKATWRAAADWHFVPEHMVYASVSTGFKSAAFNTNVPPANSADMIVAQPETITSYEAGLKGDFGRIFSYNVSVFHSDYKDIQAQGTFADPTPRSLLSNIGDANIDGLEAELRAQPTSRLSAKLGVGLLKTEIIAPGGTFNGVPLDGNELVMAPKRSLSGSLRYGLPLEGIGSLWVSPDFNYQSAVYFGPDNLLTERQKAYTLVNLHIGWEDEDKKTSIQAFVKNLTNEHYLIHATDSGGATQVRVNWGRERTWGLQFSRSF